MKLSLLLILLNPLHIFSQSFTELDSILKITKTEFNTNELRIYRKHSTTTGLELFRFYQDKNELWKADFYQTIATRNSKNEIDIRIRKEKLNSLKNFELIWMQMIDTDILLLPQFDKIQYKLKHKTKEYEIMDGEITSSSTKIGVLDGQDYYIKIKSGNRSNEIIYPNPKSYLKHYPNVDELQSVEELLNITKVNFKILRNKMNLPPYKTFPQMSNERILLREIESFDMNDLIEISFYDAIQAKTEIEAQEMQNKINLDYLNGNSIHWGIVERSTNKIVGTCGYYRGFENESGELGCILLPQFRGLGFMSAAMQLAIDFGFKDIGLQKIWATTDHNNKETIKLLTRLHFKKTSKSENGELVFEIKPL